VGWSNAFWQVYSTLMIFLAAGHGLNGVRMVLEDYLSRPLLVTVLRTALFVLWLALLIVAIYVILAS
jgi:succinate dehydrogenase hydrophobic anchor subunit